MGSSARGRATVAGALLLAVAAAACGGDDSGGGAGEASGATTTLVTVAPEGTPPEDAPVLPVTTTGADGEAVTVTDAGRIIAANGDIAEVVFALGLGDAVVATDLSATFPPEADALPEIGYQRSLLVEPMLTHEPTVVVANTDAGPDDAIAQLREVGVPVVVLDYPHDLTGPAAKIRLVAAALGVPARGEALAREVTAAIDDAAAEADARVEAAGGDRPRVAFLYLRGDSVQQLGGRGSRADALIEAAGGIDVGVELGLDDFEPLTSEALVVAAPDVLLVTTTGLDSVGGIDALVGIPAISGTPAGRDRRVVALDDQLLLGLGPRTGDALDRLVAELHPPAPTDTETDTGDTDE